MSDKPSSSRAGKRYMARQLLLILLPLCYAMTVLPFLAKPASERANASALSIFVLRPLFVFLFAAPMSALVIRNRINRDWDWDRDRDRGV